MDLSPNDDQIAVLDAIEALAKPFAELPSDCRSFDLYSAALDAALGVAGFHDVATMAELGPVTAALVIDRIAELPRSAEVAASALVRASLAPDLPRPLALVDASTPDRPVRFLPVAAAALVLDGDEVALVTLGAGDSTPVVSLFAYPMGRLRADALAGRTSIAMPAAGLRRCWQLALAVEMGGLLRGALASAVRHVSEREQFGRPIGTFQAVRHRLAEAEVKVNGLRLLARRAAFTGDAGDAALAAFHAQDSATTVLYDLHQFHGAMGMTLEHPLHLWTYRAKALLSELGGRGAQAKTAADMIFERPGAAA